MRTFAASFLLPCLLVCSACSLGSKLSPPEVVPSVDLDRYAGCWYEIASVPMWFQRGCVATTATYVVKNSSTLIVRNRCYDESLEGELREVRGEARVVDPREPAKLEVQFDTWWGIFSKGQYWIVMLDSSYRFSVVSGPERRRIWILGRAPVMNDSEYNGIIEGLTQRGFDVSQLVRTPQPLDAPRCEIGM